LAGAAHECALGGCQIPSQWKAIKPNPPCADTYRMLNNRIIIFTSLPLMSLDKISLQRRFDDIGKTKTDVMREKA
jgi:hypothetical protein